MSKTRTPIKLTFYEIFWIFLLGSVSGVLLEGLFCLIFKGQWESHVVSVFGWFNLLYGVGAAGFYIGSALLPFQKKWIKILIMAVIATALEYICGLLLLHAFGMRAWDYSDQPLHFQGLICPLFFLVWVLAASSVCIPFEILQRFFKRLEIKPLKIIAVVLSVFLCLNFILTFFSIGRWSARHYKVPAKNSFEVFLDQTFPDEWMQSRFVEWEFLDAVKS